MPKKAHSGFLRATVRPLFSVLSVLLALSSVLVHAVQSAGVMLDPLTAEETISALH